MSIDLASELTVRCIAHNVGRRFPALTQNPDEHEDAATEYAYRVAFVIDPANAQPLAVAAVALWRAGFGPRSEPIHATMSGLQPEEDPAHD